MRFFQRGGVVRLERSVLKSFGQTVVAVVIVIALLVAIFDARQAGQTNLFADVTNQTDPLHPTVVFTASPAAQTLAQAFSEDHQVYYPEDQITALPAIGSGLPSLIVVHRALPVTLTDSGRTQTVRTWAKTVIELIQEKNLPEIGVDDKVTPALSAPLNANSVVTIVRVEITNVIENSAIPFQTTKQNDNTLDQGKTKVAQAGVNGQLASTYQVRRENGIEVSRKLLGTNVVKAPQNEILIIGTKPVITIGCAGYDATVLDAAIKNGVDPNALCYRLVKESNGHANSVNPSGPYDGLLQYDPNFWSSVSSKAGYPGASIWDANAQIYVTAWAWAHGYRGRWPIP